MNDDVPAAGVLMLIILGVWVIFGNPLRDIRGWIGSQTYEDQIEILTEHVKKKKIGTTPDYWLTKTSVEGKPDRVALIFGMWGDYEFCKEIAELYIKKYSQSGYYCLPANVE